MEGNNRKRKGFMKGKLVLSLYRATKPSPTLLPHHQYNEKVVNPTTTLYSSASSVGFIVNQDKVNPPQPKQRVSFIIPDNGHDSSYYGKFDNNYNNNNSPLYGVAGDEGVDVKAASYISCVQERFRLERVNSERMMSQDNTTMQ